MSSPENYTLARMYEEAQVSEYPDWAHQVVLRHPDIPDFKPRWHQILGLNLGMVHTRAALYDEQGTGKTLPAQAWAIWHAGAGNRVVIMMPPILIPQFARSLRTTFEGIEDHVKIGVYYGTQAQRNKLATEWLAAGAGAPGIFITSVDMFRREWPLFKSLGVFALLCDECKYWANPDSKTYGVIRDYLGPVGEVAILGMNGTPAKNNLCDLFGYIKLLTPHVYTNKTHFYKEHVILKTVKSRYKKDGELIERDVEIVDSFKNVAALRHNAMLQARRVEKKDVVEIPPLQIIDFPVELSKKHKEKYRQFAVAKVLEFPDGTAISGEQTATMRQICMRAVVDTDILQVDERSAVLDALEELFEEIDVERNKVYVGAYYNKTIEIICERFKHLHPAMIYGPNAGKNQKEIQKFLTNPKCRIGVANYQSGGVGLNLQDVCHYGIAAEPITVPGDFDQWTDRMHRSGQKHKTTIYSLSVPGTIWVKAQQAMLKKAAWNKGVVSSTQLKEELMGGK